MIPSEPEITELIEELRVEKPEITAVTNEDSHMIIVAGCELWFNAEESGLLLSSPDSVRKLFEEFDVGTRLYAKSVSVELHGIEANAEVMAELEKQASLVEEV